MHESYLKRHIQELYHIIEKLTALSDRFTKTLKDNFKE